MTPTTALINQLITDLDSGRANGTIYTYGQVQERLRAIVAAEADAAVGYDREPQPEDGPDYHAEHAAWARRQTGVK